MLGHEVHDREIGHAGDFAGVVELDLGRRLQPGCVAAAQCRRPAAPAHRGDRVFADLALDPAALDRLIPFADRHQPDRFRQPRDDIRGVAVALPAPVGDEDVALGLPR